MVDRKSSFLIRKQIVWKSKIWENQEGLPLCFNVFLETQFPGSTLKFCPVKHWTQHSRWNTLVWTILNDDGMFNLEHIHSERNNWNCYVGTKGKTHFERPMSNQNIHHKAPKLYSTKVLSQHWLRVSSSQNIISGLCPPLGLLAEWM